MPGFYRRRRYSYRRRVPTGRRYSRRIGRRSRFSRTRFPRRTRQQRMLRVRRPRITTSNFIGDTAVVRFRNETQFNAKQAAADYGTSFTIPGNYLPDVDVPTLSQYIAMYDTARIIRSTLKVTFTNIEATYSKTVGVTQLPLNATSGPTPSTTVYLSEQPRTRSSYLTPLSGSKSNVTMLVSGSTKTAYGSNTVTTSQQDVLDTSSMTSPAAGFDAWRWEIWTQNVSGAGTLETAGTNVRVLQWYTIQFLDRKQSTS